MTFWLMIAVLTAVLTVWVVTPLMNGAARTKNVPLAGWLLVALLPAAALLLYAALGRPELIY